MRTISQSKTERYAPNGPLIPGIFFSLFLIRNQRFYYVPDLRKRVKRKYTHFVLSLSLKGVATLWVRMNHEMVSASRSCVISHNVVFSLRTHN